MKQDIFELFRQNCEIMVCQRCVMDSSNLMSVENLARIFCEKSLTGLELKFVMYRPDESIIHIVSFSDVFFLYRFMSVVNNCNYYLKCIGGWHVLPWTNK